MVTVVGIAGNHSRMIADYSKDIKDERLDSLITWSVGQITSHIPNITVVTDNLDSTVTKVNIRGKDYVLTHGDMTDTSDSSISKLVMALGSFPYAILCGHKHSPMYKEVNGLKIIQSGSLAGSGDDYCIQKRLTGRANQTLIVTDEQGLIDAMFNVELS
jgi:predicted phosphodiesterase